MNGAEKTNLVAETSANQDAEAQDLDNASVLEVEEESSDEETGDEEGTEQDANDEVQPEGDNEEAGDEEGEPEEGAGAETEEEVSEAGKADSSDESKADESEAKAPPAAAAKRNEKEFYSQITNEAKSRVAQIMGEDFDEFNPEHTVALNIESQNLVSYVSARQSAGQKADEIVAKHGGQKFIEEWKGYMGEMKQRDYQAMFEAEQHGDFSVTLRHMEACAAKKKAASVNAGAKAAAIANAKTPPKTMPSGTGSAPAKRKDKSVFGLDDIGL